MVNQEMKVLEVILFVSSERGWHTLHFSNENGEIEKGYRSGIFWFVDVHLLVLGLGPRLHNNLVHFLLFHLGFFFGFRATSCINTSQSPFPRIHNSRSSILPLRSNNINTDSNPKRSPHIMIHPKQPTLSTIILPSRTRHPPRRPSSPTISTFFSLSRDPRLPRSIPLRPLCKRNQWSDCIIPFPVVGACIT